MNKKYRTGIASMALMIILSIPVNCQNDQGKNSFTSDSVSLKSVIDEVIKTHPTVKGAEEALRNADARIGLARTGYYPVIDAGADYSNIGPLMKITIPNMGTFQLYPENNYSAEIDYRQVIYDFGRTRTNIQIETEGKAIGEKTLDQTRQIMALATINNFYTLAYLQSAIVIKDEELKTLQAHLKYVETMKATGAATDYEVLTTKVKISSAESQKSDLLAALAIQQSYLSCLTGRENWLPVVREELEASAQEASRDSLLTFAYHNRDEMAINSEKAIVAGLRYQQIKAQDKPVINFMASGGAKNGYLPNLDKITPNYVVGVNISVPIFSAMKTKYNLLQAKSTINTLNYETENTKRNITSEVREAEEYVASARQKEAQFTLQLEQAQKAFSLAEISYESGTITNLELLDASTTVSESRLMLLKSKIDLVASIYRLKAALGERLY
ncbi:MAG: TolC family protein [Bacteroidales bacterium]|jgi:outer membrane protein TolC